MNQALSALGATWKKVEATTGSFTNVPDGDYVGDLKEMKLAQSKKGRWQVEFTWEVADGELTGKTQKQFYGVTDNVGKADAVGMGYFKGVCEVIGLDLPEDANLWQEHLDAFITENSTALYDIAVKSNGNYANVYVNSVSEYTKGGEEAEAATEEFETANVEEEIVEEEVAEEEQQVVAPVKKVIAKVTPTAKPVAKAAAQPVKKIVQLSRK
jgi:hypothetical protein